MNKQTILEKSKKNIKNFLQDHPDGIVIIWGPTASGKTSLSIKLSKIWDTEIISSDSRQIYKNMDIGTDKASKKLRDKIPHHMIDLIHPDEKLTARERKAKAKDKINQIQNRWKLPMIVGGTGLYIDTLYRNYNMPDVEPDQNLRTQLEQKEKQNKWYLHNYLKQIDPKSAKEIHPNNTRYLIRAIEIYEKSGKPKSYYKWERPVPWPMCMIGLQASKQTVNPKIDSRIHEMIEDWLLQEVKNLQNQGYKLWDHGMNAIWYKEILKHLNGEYDLQTAIERLKTNTHQYAKRQRTWFRKYIKEARTNPKQNVYYHIYGM